MNGDRAAEAEITRLEAARAQAIVAGDVATLAAMTCDDYVHVDSGGRTRDKAAFLAGARGDQGRFVRYDLIGNAIRIIGEAAIVTGLFENAMRAPDGSIVAKRARHVRVYVRGAEGWSNLLHQATGVPG